MRRGWKKTIVGSSGFGLTGSERNAKVTLFLTENVCSSGREVTVAGEGWQDLKDI